MKLTAPEEEALLRRCQAGDRDAFAALYHAYKEKVLQYAWGLLKDYDAALDVVQETFLYLFRKLHSYEERGRFRFLLFKATRNLCLTAIQKRKRITVTPVEELPLADETPDPAANLKAEELKAGMAEALAELPLIHADVLRLRFQEDYSYAEIADISECSIGTVKSRIHNGLLKLETVLKQRSLPLKSDSVGEDS